VAEDAHVGLGKREPGAADQAEQPPLGLRAGQAGLVTELREEGPRAGSSAVALRDAAQVGVGDEPENARLLHGAGEIVAADRRRQVEQRAGGRGHRHAAVDGPLDGGDVVDADARPRAPFTTGHGHVDRPVDLRTDPPQGGGPGVAQHGPLAARSDGGDLGGEWPGDGADEVHAPMAPDQPAVPRPRDDRVARQPRIEELGGRQDALRRGGASDGPAIDVRPTFIGHSPHFVGRITRCTVRTTKCGHAPLGRRGGRFAP
jgi:hypothetical protein